ncbi:T9SS type A sorting domain-containing protein [bacterium]|nr:T9SS type A sorting domain-containing protein [bacterium]
MTKRILSIACLAIFCLISLVHAQTWTQIGPYDLDGGKTWIDPHREGVLFVETSEGMQRSADNGDTWNEVLFDIDDVGISVLQFHPVSPDTVWVLGYWGWIQQSWFFSTDGTEFQAWDFDFPPELDGENEPGVKFRYDPFATDHLLACLPHHEPTWFAESWDGGDTWSDAWEFAGMPDSLYWFGSAVQDLAFDPHQQDRLIATVDYYLFPTTMSTLIQSLDGGQTWQPIADEPTYIADATGGIQFHPTIPGLLFARYNGFYEPGYYLSEQYVSFDNGQTLVDVPDPVGNHSTIQIMPDGTIFASNRHGIYESDNGQNWSAILPEEARWPLTFADWNYGPPNVHIAPWDHDHIFLNGYGQLFRSNNGGVTWQDYGPAGIYKPLEGIVASPNGQTLYAYSRSGVSLSTDGGDTWQRLFSAVDPIIAVSPTNPERVLFRWFNASDYTPYQEELQLSMDQGLHWGAILDAHPDAFAFDPQDPDRIYTSANNRYSTDGGQTWQQADLDNGVDVFRFDRDEPSAVYALTRYSGVSKSEDDGATYTLWGDPDFGYVDADFRAGDDHAVFFDPYPGNEFALYSHDNGLTFDHAVTSPPEPRTDILLFTPSGALVALCEDGLYESTDEGLSWQRVAGDYPVYLASYDYPTAWTIADNGTVFIAAEDGGLWRGEEVLGVDDNNQSAPVANEFDLPNVYPNPFNPELTVTVTLPAPSEVELRIVNIAGQTVATLTHGETLSTGTHDFSFDGSPFASGIYFVRAEMPGRQTQLRKVTLLK